MPTDERYAEIPFAGQGSVALVLDASESAHARWQAILVLALGVLDSLPASADAEVYFLGNPKPYSVADLRVNAAACFEENRQRASLIAPVWAGTRPGGGRTWAVIGSGPVFDLEDWIEHVPGCRLVLASVGEPLHAGGAAATETADPDAAELLALLHDPVSQITVSGPGFMPLKWKGAAFRLAVEEGGAGIALQTDKVPEGTVGLTYLIAREGKATARLRHASGKTTETPLEVLPPLRGAGPAFAPLPGDEAERCRAAMAREDFNCACCGGRHAWHVLRCDDDPQSLLGAPIYPSLESREGIVILRADADGVLCSAEGLAALKLPDGRVALREGGRAALWEYDENRALWRRTGQALEPCHPIGGGEYAIVI